MDFRSYVDQTSPVIAHVAGPAGVGKTTLMNKIKQTFPQILVLDLDQLDSYGTRKMNLPITGNIPAGHPKNLPNPTNSDKQD